MQYMFRVCFPLCLNLFSLSSRHYKLVQFPFKNGLHLAYRFWFQCDIVTGVNVIFDMVKYFSLFLWGAWCSSSAAMIYTVSTNIFWIIKSIWFELNYFDKIHECMLLCMLDSGFILEEECSKHRQTSWPPPRAGVLFTDWWCSRSSQDHASQHWWGGPDPRGQV